MSNTTDWTSFWKQLNAFPVGEGQWSPLVPRTGVENLNWRKKLLYECRKDVGLQREVRHICKHDFRFWMRSFAWAAEPRRTSGDVVFPLQPWDCQEWIMTQLLEYWGVKEMLFDKSRDMGATWFTLYRAYHDWAFWPDCSIAMISQKAELVEKPNSGDALFSKLDLIYKYQPPFLRPDRDRVMFSMRNLHNGSTLVGTTTTGDAFRGGRHKVVIADEFAAFDKGMDYDFASSVGSVTNCVIYISTVKRAQGLYYEMREQRHEKDYAYLELDWKMKPMARAGLYTSADGLLVKIDPDYAWPADYKFILDGRVRSPWYDRQCNRPGMTRKIISRELDRTPDEAGGTVFDAAVLEAHKKAFCLEPLRRGRLLGDAEEFRYLPSLNGPLQIWCAMSDEGVVPTAEYVIAADISNGAGREGSNSVAAVMRADNYEMVALYVCDNESPPVFAESCVALAKMFHGAHLGWESNGPGQSFKGRIIELGYGHIFYDLDRKKRNDKRTKSPGWHNNAASKIAIIEELSHNIEKNIIVVRDAETLKECLEYVWNGEKPEHRREKTDDTGEKQGGSHGDRVIALAIANLMLRGHRKGVLPATPKKAARDNLQARIEAASQLKRNFAEASCDW